MTRRVLPDPYTLERLTFVSQTKIFLAENALTVMTNSNHLENCVKKIKAIIEWVDV